ncbi:MAG: hypothetical protein K8I60_23155, partial [Anaerolineae bacterium]|nr:hypothetical protein [Anaerolineae bacterium]
MQTTSDRVHERIFTTSRGPFFEFARTFVRNRSGMVGLALVVFFVVISVAGLLRLTPFPILEQHPRDRLKPPNEIYILGTDQFGRDVASNVMKGGANSLQVAGVSVLLSTLAGTMIGALAGYWGGNVDTVLMRLMDIL